MEQVSYRLQWRHDYGPDLPNFPWETSPIGWNNPDSAFEELTESRRRDPNRDYRVVKITTEECTRPHQ